MAQYIDDDTNGSNGRIFSISADRIEVSVNGATKALLVASPIANIATVAVPFASLTAATNAYNDLLQKMKDAGVMASS